MYDKLNLNQQAVVHLQKLLKRVCLWWLCIIVVHNTA